MSLSGSNVQPKRRATDGLVTRMAWFIFSFGVVTGLAATAAWVAGTVQIPMSAKLDGELTKSSELQTIYLPIGLNLLSVQVRTGSKVAAGDVIALLEPASISLAVRRAETAIAADRQLFACLQDIAAPLTSKIDLAEAPLSAEVDLPDTLSAAADRIDCAIESQREVAGRAAIEAEISNIDQRIALVGRRLELAFLSAQTAGSDQIENTQLALGLAWARIEMETRRLALGEQRTVRAQILATAIAARLRVIAARVDAAEVALAALLQHQSDPRIFSPTNATIVHTYAVSEYPTGQTAVKLLELAPDIPVPFEIRVALPDTINAAVREGSLVWIKPVGTTPEQPALAAKVSQIVAKPQADSVTPFKYARIALAPEIAVELERMSAQSGFARTRAAIEVRVALPNTNLSDAVKNVLSQIDVQHTSDDYQFLHVRKYSDMSVVE